MEKPAKTRNGRAASETDSAHLFSAAGTASFIKCVRDASIEWETDKPAVIEAEAGMSESAGSVSALPRGVYQISPYESARLTARFKQPVYLLTTQKLYDVLSNRYVLDVKLYSRWELNFWPLFLDHYLATGRWASTKEEMREFGAMLVADFRKNATPELKKLSKLKRLRKQFPVIMITRFNVDSTLRKWSKKHWANIYRKFFNSPHFEEMSRNAELLRTLRGKMDGLVALKSVMKQDDLAFAMPLELAAADSLQVKKLVGLAKIDGTCSGSERSKCVSSLQLDSVLLGPTPLPCEFAAERAQAPLVTGAKKAYGATMQAPIILKGENVSGTLEQNQPDLNRRMISRVRDLVNSDRTPDISENTADLKVTLEAAES